MVVVKYKGDDKTEKFFARMLKSTYLSLRQYGEKGVAALQAATPVNTGLTAASWSYDISRTKSGWSLTFSNSNVQNGIPIAILLQYGHGTRNGGYVEGIDYINPALKPIFDEIAQEAWREVTK